MRIGRAHARLREVGHVDLSFQIEASRWGEVARHESYLHRSRPAKSDV